MPPPISDSGFRRVEIEDMNINVQDDRFKDVHACGAAQRRIVRNKTSKRDFPSKANLDVDAS